MFALASILAPAAILSHPDASLAPSSASLIPVDPASIFTLVLAGAAVALVIWSGTRKGGGGGGGGS